MRVLFDLESDGLLQEITKIWCICTKELDSGRELSFGPDNIFAGLLYLSEAEQLIGHNIIGYDIPAIRKLNPWWRNPKVVDTLTISRLLNPDRPGGHSLDAWGLRTGVAKPVHEDWSKFSPEMLYRCQQDVLNNERVLEMLMLEMEK